MPKKRMGYLRDDDKHGALMRYRPEEWKAMIEKFMKDEDHINLNLWSISTFIADEPVDLCPKGTDQEVVYIEYSKDDRSVRFWTDDYYVQFHSSMEHNWGKGVDEDRMDITFKLRKPLPNDPPLQAM